MKHTKGNWTINHYENGAKSIKLEGDKDKEIACLHYGGMMLDKEELAANTKLIAAAPELLEVLQSIDKYYFQLMSRTVGEVPSELHKEVRQAIKKATS